MARWFIDRSPHKGIPSVSLRRLLPDAQFLGCRDLVVSGCSSDSRRLDPGQVFVALKGTRHDGHCYIARALERGAAGVVVEQPCPEAGSPQVVVADARQAHARLCQALAGEPSEELSLIGIAGSAGRSVTALFLHSIFEAAGMRYGLVGRLGWTDGHHNYPPGAREPGAVELAEMLLAMVDAGCAGGILEMSQGALERRSFDGITLDAAAITDAPRALNTDLRAWRRGHTRLFRMVTPGGATIVHADDREIELLGTVNLDAHRVAYGLDGDIAEISAVIERQDAQGTRFRLRGFEREMTVELSLAGPHVVPYALAAAAVAWARGLAARDVAAGLQAVTHVPGRLHAIREGQDFALWIDAARTARELREILGFLRDTSPGQIHLVLSADGSADERAALARTAELWADRVTLSIDDPQCEDVDAILDETLSGFRRPGRVRLEPDRRRAIESTLAVAVAGDAVLIVGGTRRMIAISDKRAVACDDRALATTWLRQHRAEPRRRSA
jgi:UDP-N-acetylmuramoyl-L-alanyl-D-glutamate--2,6-diaminopimelate ligase